MKPDHKKRAVKCTLAGKNRLQDRKAYEAAVGKDGGKLTDFALIKVFVCLAGKKRKERHHWVEDKPDGGVKQPLAEKFPTEILGEQGAHNHHRLP